MRPLSATESLALATLQAAPSLTVHQITRRTQHSDGRVIRVVLDDLCALGLAEYVEGAGNNRRYRAAVAAGSAA